MKNLNAIIEEQALWLKWNGYTEKLLHNGEALGSYKEQLKSAIQDILDRDETLIEKEAFQVNLFGYFNHGKEKVLFTFSYEFDPLISTVTLTQIEARLNNVPLIIPVEKNSDMWMAEELYSRVKQLSTPFHNALETQKVNQVAHMIHHELKLLKDNGYTGEKLELHFRNAINKATATPDKESHFIIRGKISVKEQPGMMQYRLHYYFHPELNHLYLKSVNARLNNISKTFIGTSKYPIPPAPDIYNYLLQEQKTFLAKKIMAEQPPSHSIKNRKV